MAAFITLRRAGLGTLVLLAVAVATASSAPATILDLRADGSNRLEIDFPALSVPSNGRLELYVLLYGDAAYVGRYYRVSGPGTLVVPYSDLPGLEGFDHNVKSLELHFNFNQASSPGGFVVGEIRTALTPTAAENSSWGRIKEAYRR